MPKKRNDREFLISFPSGHPDQVLQLTSNICVVLIGVLLPQVRRVAVHVRVSQQEAAKQPGGGADLRRKGPRHVRAGRGELQGTQGVQGREYTIKVCLSDI